MLKLCMWFACVKEKKVVNIISNSVFVLDTSQNHNITVENQSCISK